MTVCLRIMWSNAPCTTALFPAVHALPTRAEYLRFDNMHRLLKTAGKQRPGSFPAVALDQAAQTEDGLAADLTPWGM
jgi:hypothetical protein